MPAQESSSVVQIGEWMVHPELDSISRGTETQKLEPRAMRLLLCLANSAGEVVSIDRLLTEVWAGVVVGSASVYEAVSQLRKILGDVDSKPTYIATVPRKGYRLIALVGREGAPADTPHAPAIQPRKVAPQRLWTVAGAIVAALIAAYVLGDKAWLSKHTAGKGQTPGSSVVVSDKSIAVLPFTDMSEKKDQEYFADGMAEELIGLLAQVPELHVPARTSSFYFKSRRATMTEIAGALGVSHVLEGSVRKSGDTVRVTAQLIRADTGFTVWSHTYDRQIDDIFKIQDEIAGAVTKSLKVSLGVDVPTADTGAKSDAYILYLQGRALNQRRTQIDNAKAISYLRRALQVDPMFAPAWAATADTLIDDFMYFAEKPYKQTRDEAYAAADRALQIEPKLTVAHVAKARLLYVIDWDIAAAEKEVSSALSFSPNDSQALRLASELATTMGRGDAALEFAQTAVANDPLDARGFARIAGAQIGRGDLTAAESQFRKAIELNPSAASIHYQLASLSVARGDAARALEEAQREPDEAFRLAGLALAFDALGRKEEADRTLSELQRRYASRSAYQIVEILAMRGDLNGAFEWLDRAYTQHDVGLVKMISNPLLKGLKGDGRFTAVVHKAKLPE
jgi:TolB-like protein/DNA-binding winged helix-turn-helix (wHTH) protein/Flp pilus assembly protein TadD